MMHRLRELTQPYTFGKADIRVGTISLEKSEEMPHCPGPGWHADREMLLPLSTGCSRGTTAFLSHCLHPPKWIWHKKNRPHITYSISTNLAIIIQLYGEWSSLALLHAPSPLLYIIKYIACIPIACVPPLPPLLSFSFSVIELLSRWIWGLKGSGSCPRTTG